MQLTKDELNKIKVAGICFMIVGVACLAVAILVQSQLTNINLEIQQSKLSADAQVESINNLARISSFCSTGGIIFLVFGATVTIFSEASKPSKSDKSTDETTKKDNKP